jgi:hypothetical protein
MNSLETATERTCSSYAIAGLRRRAALASASFACLLALLALGSLREGRDLPSARWQDRLNKAEVAMRNGDIYSARSFYSQAARIASWTDDWTGILAAACGLRNTERPRDNYFVTRTALVRAMIAARNQQSTQGLNAVADAFAGIGEHHAAALARSHIPTDAPQGTAQSSQPWRCG